MASLRIFVSYTDTDTIFAKQLITDLRNAGAEVATDCESIADGAFVQFLYQELAKCQWLILVQTPDALRSLRVQMAVNTALNLVGQHKMKGVLRVNAALPDVLDAQELPMNWTAAREFDASQDYPRALARVLLTLGLIRLDDPIDATSTSTLPATDRFSQPPLADTGFDRSRNTDIPIKLAGSHPTFLPRRLSRRTVVIGLAALATAGIAGSTLAYIPHIVGSSAGKWESTGQLLLARRRFSATTLKSGMVLIAGGAEGPTLSTNESELFNPQTGAWTQTGSLSEGRSEHIAARLPDGTVLVAGGYGGSPTNIRNSAELYDPVTGTWRRAGSMNEPRVQHAGLPLSNGDVLVVGGWSGGTTSSLSSAEYYDYKAGKWLSAGNMATPRVNPVAVQLPGGKVLVAGGNSSGWQPGGEIAEAELYDHTTNTWASTGRMQVPRSRFAAVLLPTKKVLVIGGGTPDGPTQTAELYEPITGQWALIHSMMYTRESFSAVVLTNGTILVAGGDMQGTSEIYDPVKETWSAPIPMGQAHCEAATTVLADGRVLVTGGSDCGLHDKLATTTIYTPA